MWRERALAQGGYFQKGVFDMVGSFRDRKEAEQQKANLALIGVESRVEKVTIDNDQTWYRVRIGPEKDQRKVEQVLAQLEENDIKAVVMMVPN